MDPATPMKSLIDAADLAVHLGITVNAVYRLSATGRIPRYKVGHRTVRFDLLEVLAALKGPAEEQVDVPTAGRARPPRAQPPSTALPSFDWSSRS